jgi:hypothetical protein
VKVPGSYPRDDRFDFRPRQRLFSLTLFVVSFRPLSQMPISFINYDITALFHVISSSSIINYQLSYHSTLLTASKYKKLFGDIFCLHLRGKILRHSSDSSETISRRHIPEDSSTFFTATVMRFSKSNRLNLTK